MKKILCIFMVSLFLVGCQRNVDNTNRNDNIVEDVKEDSEEVVNNLEKMFDDFTNQGIKLDNYEKIEHTGLNAHEAYSLTTNGSNAYIYRLNTNDTQMQQLIDHVKQTGTADVMIEDEKKQYEAAVNGNVLLLYEKDSNLTDLRKAFEKFQAISDTSHNMNK